MGIRLDVDEWVPGPARRSSVGLPGHLGAGDGLEADGPALLCVGASFWALTTRGISASGAAHCPPSARQHIGLSEIPR